MLESNRAFSAPAEKIYALSSAKNSSRHELHQKPNDCKSGKVFLPLTSKMLWKFFWFFQDFSPDEVFRFSYLSKINCQVHSIHHKFTLHQTFYHCLPCTYSAVSFQFSTSTHEAMRWRKNFTCGRRMLYEMRHEREKKQIVVNNSSFLIDINW